MANAIANDSPKYRNSLICCSPRNTSISDTPSSSTSGCVSADECYDSNYMPKAIANNKLKINNTASKSDVEKAITQCKEILLNTPQCSEERNWLVRYLVELRLRLEDLKEDEELPRLAVVIKGHHFKQQSNPGNRKQYCDHCSGVIWSIVQGSYICSDCNYVCHYKCVDEVCRTCAHVAMTEKGCFDIRICPEIGLASQDYKCAECQTPLTFKDDWNEPRLCDYTGFYFCATCHWNDKSAIPARVVHNWDWSKHFVSRFAFQMLNISWELPYIDIETLNPKLINFIAEFEWVHKMRKDLEWIRKYLCACPQGKSLLTSLFVQLGDVNKKYSMAHLQAIESGTLLPQLTELTEVCRSHITNCVLCSGKGYLCEICGNKEVLYPFDNGAIMCDKCNCLYHRGCWLRKGQNCSKCLRLKDRKNVADPSDEEQMSYCEFDIDKFVEYST